jgi:predicted AlkP superfamily pyrophosphatase or phosphodiesterase
MRKLIVTLCLSISLWAQPQTTAPPQPATRTRQPKLILAIMVDQLRYDYLTRFSSEYTGGIKRLLDQGAVFTNAHYEATPTVTSVGHSIFLTGAPPALSGIVSNDWWDRVVGKRVTSVSDDSTQLLGSSGTGSSPWRLLQSTVGDELKLAGRGGKTIGISLKDRSAILPAGRMADGAYWFNSVTGAFVSSTYYFPKLPAWVEEFNRARPADKYAGRKWLTTELPADPGADLYGALDATPFSDELLEQLALNALSAEKLGTGDKTDLLAISYSATDYVGHRFGPDSPEAHDVVTHVDKMIGELLQAAEAQAGSGNVLVVLSADHGVAPVPELNQQRNMPGGRINWTAYTGAVEYALAKRWGEGKWFAYSSDGVIYFNADPVPGKKIDPAEIQRVAAEALRAQDHIFRVYTYSQLLNGAIRMDQIDQRVRNGFNAARSGDIFTILDPYWIFNSTGTSHGTPYDYDAHVPVIFLGPQIRPGSYPRNIGVQDIAPTLATILGIETPSGSTGRVLDEILR